MAGVASIMAWSGGLTAVIWTIGKQMNVIRAPVYEEVIGIDFIKHSGTMLPTELEYLKEKI